MFRILCAKVAAAFPPLPPLPWRPLLGAGAAVGPIRPAVVCVAILCGSSAATAPPHLSELIPRVEPAVGQGATRRNPAELGATAVPVPIPAPGGALIMVPALGFLAVLLWQRGK